MIKIAVIALPKNCHYSYMLVQVGQVTLHVRTLVPREICTSHRPTCLPASAIAILTADMDLHSNDHLYDCSNKGNGDDDDGDDVNAFKSSQSR
eukprot:4984016-Amphidinium_carterae.1